MDIAQAVAKVFGARIASQIIGFLGLVYFARELGAGQLGIFFLFQAALSILALPADIGVREGIEKRISEGEDPEKILTTGLLLKIGFSLALGIGLFVARNPVNEYIGGQVTVLLIIALVLNALSEVAIRTLKGELRVGETASLQFARQVVWVGVGAFFVWMGFGYVGLIYSLILGFGVVFLWGMHKRSTEFGTVSREHASSLWTYSKYSFVGAVGGSFYSWMDVAIIGFFLSQTHVGAYEMAWRVGIVVTLLSNAIATTIFPQVSEWNAEENQEQIESLIPNAITPAMLLVVPAFFGSLFLSREILGLLFGQDFVIAWLVLIIFMAINFVQAITGILARTLRAINHPELVAKARIVSITLNVVLNIILIWKFGIIGAAVATGIALTIYTLLVVIYLRRFITIQFPHKEVGWCVVSSVGMSILVVSMKSIIEINTLPRLFGIVGAGVIVYFTLVTMNADLRFKIINSTARLLS